MTAVAVARLYREEASLYSCLVRWKVILFTSEIGFLRPGIYRALWEALGHKRWN